MRMDYAARELRVTALPITEIAVFLQNQRLARARFLLTDPRLNVAEVTRLSGFSSASYFIRLFRARHRRTPTQMRSAAVQRGP